MTGQKWKSSTHTQTQRKQLPDRLVGRISHRTRLSPHSLTGPRVLRRESQSHPCSLCHSKWKDTRRDGGVSPRRPSEVFDFRQCRRIQLSRRTAAPTAASNSFIKQIPSKKKMGKKQRRRTKKTSLSVPCPCPKNENLTVALRPLSAQR